jgi:hypothetical protein
VSFSGKFNAGGAQPFDFAEQISRRDSNSVNCSWRLRSSSGIDSAQLFVSIQFPSSYEGESLDFDGVPLLLPPAKATWQNLHFFRNVKSITVPAEDGKYVFSGTLSGLVFIGPESGPYYEIRINATPAAGKITDSQVKLDIAFRK